MPNTLSATDIKLAMLQARLEKHEAVCEQRQGTIITRLNRIEALVMTACGSVIVGLLWLVFVRHGL